MIKKTYLTHKETIHNFIWRSLQTFGKQGITFLIFILCAKLLTPYDFGIYNYALAIIFFLIIFGDFGISTATSKYVAEYNVTDKNKLKAVLFNSGIIILGLTIIITLLTLLIGPWYLKEKYVYVLWLLPLVFMAPMTSLYDGIYRGLKKFKQLAIISLIVGIFSLSFVYILIKTYGLVGALIAQNLFYLILLIALGLGYREFNFRWNKEVAKEISGYSLIIGIGGLGFFLYTRMGVVILGYYNYIEQISSFEIINKILMILVIPFTILGEVIAPDITKKIYQKNYKTVRKEYIKFLISSIIAGIILSATVYAMLPLLIKNFLGAYYNQDFLNMLIILLFLFPLTASANIISTGFTVSTGRAKYSLLTIPFGVLNLIFSIILVIYLGFMGVIYATVMSSTLNRLITFYLLNKDLKKYE